jgi:hypothetical protein
LNYDDGIPAEIIQDLLRKFGGKDTVVFTINESFISHIILDYPISIDIYDAYDMICNVRNALRYLDDNGDYLPNMYWDEQKLLELADENNDGDICLIQSIDIHKLDEVHFEYSEYPDYYFIYIPI